MKNCINIILASMLLILSGCKEEIDSNNAEEVSVNQKDGIIPKDHLVHQEIKYSNLLDIYKSAINEEANAHYFLNFKHICLFKIFDNDSFFEQSTPKERLYLINELVKMDNALPNIDHFYKVIVFMLEKGEVEIKKAEKLIETFENKNESALQNSNMKSELKDNKLESFKDGKLKINLFYHTKRLSDFKKSQ
jgi:hypothetical protein